MKNEKDNAFSSIDFVGQCLVDRERVAAFQKVINKFVKKGDIVLDIGTGSGILSFLAVKAGAKKVYTVELDNFVAELAKKSFRANKLNKKVVLLIQDARNISLPNDIKFNVVIAEMLTTGLVDEDQVESINNLHKKGLVDSSTIFIPKKQETYISLANANLKIFDFKSLMPLHLWKWHNWSHLQLKKITNEVILNSIDFTKINNEKFSETLTFTVKKSGKINCVYLTSKTFLDDEIKLGDTEALNAPIVVPLSEKSVKIGQKIKVKIDYIFGGTYKNFKVKFL